MSSQLDQLLCSSLNFLISDQRVHGPTRDRHMKAPELDNVLLWRAGMHPAYMNGHSKNQALHISQQVKAQFLTRRDI